MDKKVIDIISPSKDRSSFIPALTEAMARKKSKEKNSKEEKREKKIKSETKSVDRQAKKSTPVPRKIILISVFVLVLVSVFVAGSFFFSKVNIKIWPSTQNKATNTTLTVDQSVQNPDFTAKVIPGEILTKEKTATQSFPATGKLLKEEKAQGKITVYNTYSSQPQALIATTRFVSVDGKIFRTPGKITVPGTTYENGKLVPGSIEINVVADEAGSEYNIGPSTFSIPGFAGTDKYTKFYAKSFTSFSGGSSQQSLQITKVDLENAKNTLTNQTKQENEAALKSEIQSSASYLDKAIVTQVLDASTVAKEGDIAQSFDYQVKVSSKTIVFSKEDLNKFSQDFLNREVVSGEKLYLASVKTDLSPQTVNLAAGKIILSLIISGQIYPDINLTDLKNNLAGKSLKEAKLFLEAQSDITKTEVEFWPFWVKRIPENTNKITLEIGISP